RRISIDFSSISEGTEIGAFQWSPDGARFLFDAGSYAGAPEVRLTTNIFTASIDGKQVIRLTNDHEATNASAAWSPDGKLIAFESNGEVCVMNYDGSNRHAISIGSEPSWSPDGSKILFKSGRFSGYEELYLA